MLLHREKGLIIGLALYIMLLKSVKSHFPEVEKK